MGLYNNANIDPYSKKLSVNETYEKLEAYYHNNQLFDAINYYASESNLPKKNIKGLRNPVHRSTEFFASKILCGELIINTESKDSTNDPVKEAIEKIHRWSNFDSERIVSSRQLSMLGDLFWKAVGESDKVYFERIHPSNVTDFSTDKRGYLTKIRLDIPLFDEETERNYTWVELWDKANNYWAIWYNYNGDTPDTDQLGEPVEYGFISDLGINFVPFVHCKFSDTGAKRGKSCVDHALSKIDEAAYLSTLIHEMLYKYNKSFLVSERPLVNDEKKFLARPLGDRNLAVTKDSVLYPPAGETLKTLSFNAAFADALSVLNAQEDEIAADLPEVRYYDLPDTISGKALRLLMGSAIDRATEARTNIVAALERINKMCLTIGSNLGLFTGIGTYENGDFEHSIKAGEMLPLDEDEIAMTLRNYGVTLPFETALHRVGFSEEEIEKAIASKDVEDQKKQSTFMSEFNAM